MATPVFLTTIHVIDRMGTKMNEILDVASSIDLKVTPDTRLTLAINDVNSLIESHVQGRYKTDALDNADTPESIILAGIDILIFQLVRRLRPAIMTPETADANDLAREWLVAIRDGQSRLFADSELDASKTEETTVESKLATIGSGLADNLSGHSTTRPFFENF